MVIHLSTNPLAHEYASYIFWISSVVWGWLRFVMWAESVDDKSIYQWEHHGLRVWAALNLVMVLDLWFG